MSFEKYLNDSGLFQFDSPYKNDENFLACPLLSNYWIELINLKKNSLIQHVSNFTLVINSI